MQMTKEFLAPERNAFLPLGKLVSSVLNVFVTKEVNGFQPNIALLRNIRHFTVQFQCDMYSFRQYR